MSHSITLRFQLPFGSAMEEDLLARIEQKFLSYTSLSQIADCRPHKDQLTKYLITESKAKREVNSKSKQEL